MVKKTRYMDFLSMRLTLRKDGGGKLEMAMTKLSDDGFDAGDWVIGEVSRRRREQLVDPFSLKLTFPYLSSPSAPPAPLPSQVPSTYTPGSELVRNGAVSFAEFESVHATLEAEKALASKISREAAKKASQVRQTLEAFEGLYASIDKSREMGWSKWKRKWKHAYRDVRRELIYEVYVNQVEKMYPGWMAETYGKEFTGQFHIKNGVWDLKRL